jgi:hypothetical protein
MDHQSWPVSSAARMVSRAEPEAMAKPIELQDQITMLDASIERLVAGQGDLPNSVSLQGMMTAFALGPGYLWPWHLDF